MSDFNDPATPTGIDYEQLNGALLLFTVHSVEEDVPTVYGPKNPVRADVAVLDGEHKSEVFADALIFPKVLIGQLRGNVGSMVLGRLGQGEAKPGTGQKPPWKLTAANDQERATGQKYIAWRATQQPVTVPVDYEEPF